jgi:outer membrane biosynthesis protein TonB
MGKSAVLSGLLHLAIIVLAIVGLPWFYEPNEILEATPIAVVSEAQFDQMKDAKKPPAQQKKPEKPPQEAAIPPAPKAPDLPEPTPEPEPQAQPEPPPQAAAPPPPAPEPPPPPPPPAPPPPQPEAQDQQQQQAVIAPPPPQAPPPEQPPVVPQEPKVAAAQPKPLPPQKPKPPKKQDPPKKDKPKEQTAEEDTTSFLNNVENKLKKKQQQQASAQQPQAAPQQQGELPSDNYDGPPVTQGEKDALAEEIGRCWSPPVGVEGVQDMSVEIRIVLNPDGSLVTQAYTDNNVFSRGPTYRAFAESASRAVNMCAPFKHLPNKPYQAWKTIVLNFTPRNMGL